jgi:septal ring factor EnvC (AmiA/AmiB activator)
MLTLPPRGDSRWRRKIKVLNSSLSLGVKCMARANQTEAETKLQGACGGMKAIIKRVENSIKTQKRILDQQRANLKKLESKPKPDTAQINTLKRTVSQMEEQLRKDEEALRDLQDVFSENCSS